MAIDSFAIIWDNEASNKRLFIFLCRNDRTIETEAQKKNGAPQIALTTVLASSTNSQFVLSHCYT